jgi:hypothetical protein
MLLTIPILLAAITLDQPAPWVLVCLAAVFILLDFFFNPTASSMLRASPNLIISPTANEPSAGGGMVNRPLALIGCAAFLSSLGAHSVEQVIARADHAEETLRLQQSFAETEARRTEQVNAFIQELVEAFVAQASGIDRYLEVSENHPLATTVPAA